MLLHSPQLAASIDFSPLTKIHQAAVLAHRFCSAIAAGRGTNILRVHTAQIFQCGVQTLCVAECPTAVQERK